MLFAIATLNSIGSSALAEKYILGTGKPTPKAKTGCNISSNQQSSLTDWLEGKRFKHENSGMIIQYGYISSLNTYGLTVTNSYSNKFYFINCTKEISSDQTYGEFYDCINPDNGSGIGTAKVYRNSKKIVVGDASGQITHILIQN